MKDYIENILIIRKGAIGDIIFTLPAYYMLKANFPNSKISFLVKEHYSEVLKGFPDLDEVLLFRKEVLSPKNIFEIIKRTSGLICTVRNNNYQLAVDLAGHGEQALFLWLNGIKHRWGSIKSTRPERRWFYTNYFIRNLENVHIIDQHLKMLENGGLTNFPVKNQYIVLKENLEKAKMLFTNWGLSLQEPTIFIQPFTGDGIYGKSWTLSCYVMLADYWRERGIQVLFGGGPSEREKLNDVATRFPVAAGQTDFLTSVGLTTLSSIVIGGEVSRFFGIR